MKTKVGIVGCGRILGKHLQAIRAFPEQLELVGVSDSDPSKLSQLDIPNQDYPGLSSVPRYRDFGEMIDRTRPDLVAILTPSGLHAEHAILAGRKKCHVLVEKPMALLLSDADDMIRACDENGVKLFVVKQNRLNRPVQAARKLFEAGRFGQLRLLTVRVRWCRDQAYYDSASWRGTWALDGGVLANQAAHHLDLLQWFGGEIVSVYASAATLGAKIEAEDTALAIVKFKSGALGAIEATTAVRPKNLEGSLSLLGEKGSVVISGVAVNKIETWNFVDSTADELASASQHSVDVDNVYGNGHVAFYRNVLEALKGDHGALVDGLEGRKSLELINALYESAETGEEIFLRFQAKKCRLGVR